MRLKSGLEIEVQLVGVDLPDSVISILSMPNTEGAPSAPFGNPLPRQFRPWFAIGVE
jgi:hypothetical protein